MSEQMTMGIESSQDDLLELMTALGFSEADIEENRQHHGRLWLSPAVVIGAVRGFAPGAKIDTKTGDVIKAGA